MKSAFYILYSFCEFGKKSCTENLRKSHAKRGGVYDIAQTWHDPDFDGEHRICDKTFFANAALFPGTRIVLVPSKAVCNPCSTSCSLPPTQARNLSEALARYAYDTRAEDEGCSLLGQHDLYP